MATQQETTVPARDMFTTVSSFRHSFEMERALQKAMAEGKCTKARVIYNCLTGEYNLGKYLTDLDEADLKWCYEQKLKALRENKRRKVE